MGELATLESLLAGAPSAEISRLQPSHTRARQRCDPPARRPERLLAQVGRVLRASPPAGVSPAYVEGFLRRNQAAMLKILERM